MWPLTYCLLMDGEFSNQKAWMLPLARRWHEQQVSSFWFHLLEDVYANGRLSLSVLPQACHQPPTHALFCKVKRPHRGKPTASNYKAICIVIHAALREEKHAHAFSFDFFPSRATSQPILVQNGSTSLLGEDRAGTMKLCPSMLCYWHEMGSVVKAEEYYHTL